MPFLDILFIFFNFDLLLFIFGYLSSFALGQQLFDVVQLNLSSTNVLEISRRKTVLGRQVSSRIGTVKSILDLTSSLSVGQHLSFNILNGDGSQTSALKGRLQRSSRTVDIRKVIGSVPVLLSQILSMNRRELARNLSGNWLPNRSLHIVHRNLSSLSGSDNVVWRTMLLVVSLNVFVGELVLLRIKLLKSGINLSLLHRELTGNEFSEKLRVHFTNAVRMFYEYRMLYEC